jgi:hypothetical protein
MPRMNSVVESRRDHAARPARLARRLNRFASPSPHRPGQSVAAKPRTDH